ncbi:unnamed protein product [Caenorhabditis bovis]|uniref:Tyrosine-protein phosphatase domain-containing protein n=1 Tax=Caenorhabditis bovis TaxID=2654633 RepID=A0A8S1EXG2_9PELO|nr:unnamed protein product [Caenorhabditis bovis]
MYRVRRATKRVAMGNERSNVKNHKTQRKKKEETKRKARSNLKIVEQVECTIQEEKHEKKKKSQHAHLATNTKRAHSTPKEPLTLAMSPVTLRAKETEPLSCMSNRINVTPSNSNTTVRTATEPGRETPPGANGTPKTEKWCGEDAARAYIDKVDANNAKKEFYDLAQLPIDIDSKCITWKKNMKKNQSEMYPCFDANLIRNTANPDEYVNATSVSVPQVSKNVIMAQFPKKGIDGSIEEFWKAIFQECVMLIHILTGSEESIDFFPQTSGQYEHFGSMFVNNRKVEKIDTESTMHLVEILPTGFSNSNMCKIIIHNSWEEQNVPVKFSSTIKSVIDVINFIATSLPDEKCAVISKHGAGRAGFFVALTSVVSSLNNKVEPRIYETVRSLRDQRPHAVDSLKQYTSLYLCLNYYIKKKIPEPAISARVQQIIDAFREMLTGASVMQ